MKSWFAVFYALLALVGIPAVVYSLIPLEGMRAAYLLVTAMFAFTSAWVFLETLAALMATKIMKTSNVDLTKDRALMQEWPPIVYVVPAFFDNEAAILPGTITAYKNLKYEGPLTVMIVYNTRKAMTAEEATFTSKYHNRKFGCTKVKVLANPGCVSEMW
jgi:signal transduction histidine kinase